MKISTRGRYALRTMVDLAQHSGDGVVKGICVLQRAITPGQTMALCDGDLVLGWPLETLMEKTILAMRSCEADVQAKMAALEG